MILIVIALMCNVTNVLIKIKVNLICLKNNASLDLFALSINLLQFQPLFTRSIDMLQF